MITRSHKKLSVKTQITYLFPEREKERERDANSDNYDLKTNIKLIEVNSSGKNCGSGLHLDGQ